jgi:alpha-L-rhamnosidase
MIILDYGSDVGGIPVFEVTSVSSTPKLQAIYSETRKYLLPDGDGSAPTTSDLAMPPSIRSAFS